MPASRERPDGRPAWSPTKMRLGNIFHLWSSAAFHHLLDDVPVTPFVTRWLAPSGPTQLSHGDFRGPVNEGAWPSGTNDPHAATRSCPPFARWHSLNPARDPLTCALEPYPVIPRGFPSSRQRRCPTFWDEYLHSVGFWCVSLMQAPSIIIDPSFSTSSATLLGTFGFASQALPSFSCRDLCFLGFEDRRPSGRMNVFRRCLLVRITRHRSPIPFTRHPLRYPARDSRTCDPKTLPVPPARFYTAWMSKVKDLLVRLPHDAETARTCPAPERAWHLLWSAWRNSKTGVFLPNMHTIYKLCTATSEPVLTFQFRDRDPRTVRIEDKSSTATCICRRGFTLGVPTPCNQRDWLDGRLRLSVLRPLLLLCSFQGTRKAGAARVSLSYEIRRFIAEKGEPNLAR